MSNPAMNTGTGFSSGHDAAIAPITTMPTAPKVTIVLMPTAPIQFPSTRSSDRLQRGQRSRLLKNDSKQSLLPHSGQRRSSPRRIILVVDSGRRLAPGDAVLIAAHPTAGTE